MKLHREQRKAFCILAKVEDWASWYGILAAGKCIELRNTKEQGHLGKKVGTSRKEFDLAHLSGAPRVFCSFQLDDISQMCTTGRTDS